MISSKIKTHLKKMEQKKFRKEFLEFTIEGIKGVEEALKSDFDIALILIQANKRDDEDILKIINKANKKNIEIEYVGIKDLESISSTKTFPGVLAIVSQKEFYLDNFLKSDNIIILDKINDPGNLGTIIRTADWFGIDKIILSEDSVDIYNPKTIRSTMGSIFHIDILQVNNLEKVLDKFKQEKFIINAFTLNGEKIDNISKNKVNKNIFLFGSESHGLRSELEKKVDRSYTITGYGQAESLNLAISAGIIMNKIKN